MPLRSAVVEETSTRKPQYRASQGVSPAGVWTAVVVVVVVVPVAQAEAEVVQAQVESAAPSFALRSEQESRASG